MINSKLNKIKKERAEKNNSKFWHKRIGKCIPEKCAGACCRYNAVRIHKEEEYHSVIQEAGVGSTFGIKKLRKCNLVIRNIICPYLTMNAKCKLHNKRTQPYTCGVFPMHHDDGVYLAVKKYCSYKFVRVENRKYRVKKKR